MRSHVEPAIKSWMFVYVLVITIHPPALHAQQPPTIPAQARQPLPQEMRPEFHWPLPGRRVDRRAWGFGTEWTWTYCAGRPKGHTGVDLAARPGEKVFAAADGTVRDSFVVSSAHDWGHGIAIDHGSVVTAYLHVVPVRRQGWVRAGDEIATIYPMNDPHLHFSVVKGPYVNVGSIARRGALPRRHGDSDHDQGRFTGCKTDPVFPGPFVDPMLLAYTEGGSSSSPTGPRPPTPAAPPAVPPSAPSPPAAPSPAPTAAIPSVSSVAPNPVPGVDGLQLLTLTGAGFVAGSQVTVRTGSQVYVIPPNRTAIVGPTQIQIHVDLTRVAAQWSAEVTNPGGRVSNRMAFTVTGASSSPPAASSPPPSVLPPAPPRPPVAAPPPTVPPPSAAPPPVAPRPSPPVAAPSPRPPTPPSASARFTVANTGGRGLHMHANPSLRAPVMTSLPEGTRMAVAGGPVQAEGYTWWKLSGTPGTGWSAVGNWLTPAPSPGGTVGVANTGGLGLRMHANPTLTAPVVTTLPEGTRMVVAGGPVQAEGYTWWKLSGTPGTGWSAVGNWLVP